MVSLIVLMILPNSMMSIVGMAVLGKSIYVTRSCLIRNDFVSDVLHKDVSERYALSKYCPDKNVRLKFE